MCARKPTGCGRALATAPAAEQTVQRVLHVEHAEVQRLSIPSAAVRAYLAALLPRPVV